MGLCGLCPVAEAIQNERRKSSSQRTEGEVAWGWCPRYKRRTPYSCTSRADKRDNQGNPNQQTPPHLIDCSARFSYNLAFVLLVLCFPPLPLPRDRQFCHPHVLLPCLLLGMYNTSHPITLSVKGLRNMQSYSYIQHPSSIVRYLFLDGIEFRPWSRQIEGIEADKLEIRNMAAATSQRAEVRSRGVKPSLFN